MAKMSGLFWPSMNAEDTARQHASPVDPLDAWCLCPACGSGGYHHLGARDHVPTGWPAAISPSTAPAAVETREHITRECLYCEHRWPQDTGVVGIHVPTFEDTLRDQLRNLAAVYSLPPAILRDTKAAPAPDPSPNPPPHGAPMTRQMIPNAVITRLTDKPEIFVYQNSGHASWVEVNDDGTIRTGPTASEWTAYQNSGGTLDQGAPLRDGDTLITIDWPMRG